MDSLSYRKPIQQQPQGDSDATEEPAKDLHFETKPAIHAAPVRRGQNTGHHSPKGAKMKIAINKLWLTVAAVVLATMAIGSFWLFSGSGASTAPFIDTSKYQAVFMTNGQVYFGKLSATGSEYLKLTDIFYLQKKQSTSESNPQNAEAQNSSDVELVKLGSELHGPDDLMVIDKKQVLFYENLKADGNVSKIIGQYKSQKK